MADNEGAACPMSARATGSKKIAGVAAQVDGTAGRYGSTASSSGNSHKVNAGPAPNTRRAGLRHTSASNNPPLT